MDHTIVALIIIGNIIVIILNVANIRLVRKMALRHKEMEDRLRAIRAKGSDDIKFSGEGKSWLLPTEDLNVN